MENDETKKSSTRTPHEFKVMRVRECAFPAQMVDTPERAVEYWKQNIINADWYDESKEALVVLVLNTRRRIIGHNLVTLGNLDSCFVLPREIFRPVIGFIRKVPVWIGGLVADLGHESELALPCVWRS